MGGISITQLLIIAVIVVLLFGTKNCARWAPISAPRSRSFKEGDRRRHAVDPQHG